MTRLFPALRLKKADETLPGVQLLDPRRRRRAGKDALADEREESRRRLMPGEPQKREGEFDPASPITNFNQIRANGVAGDDGGDHSDGDGDNIAGVDRMMSTLTPRTHHRALQAYQQQQLHPPHRHHLSYRDGAVSAQSSHSSHPLTGRPGSSPYHPSRSGRPGTSPLTRSYPHRQPFRPTNVTEARSTLGSKFAGPFLEDGTAYQPHSEIRFRDTHGANGNGGSTRMHTCTMRRAAEATSIDYYLNSPDSHSKRLDRAATLSSARDNRREFLKQLRQQQLIDRQRIISRGVKEGRIQIVEALPPRPLAMDCVIDIGGVRHFNH